MIYPIPFTRRPLGRYTHVDQYLARSCGPSEMNGRFNCGEWRHDELEQMPL